MRENADIFDFQLTDGEMILISSLRYLIASPLFLSPMENSDNIFNVKYEPLSRFHTHECRDSQARSVTFLDECRNDTPPSIFWINHQGERVFVETLEEENVINSFIGHIFECRDQRFTVTPTRNHVFVVKCA